MPEFIYKCLGCVCVAGLHHKYCVVYNERRRDEHSRWWYNTGIAKHWREVEAANEVKP